MEAARSQTVPAQSNWRSLSRLQAALRRNEHGWISLVRGGASLLTLLTCVLLEIVLVSQCTGARSMSSMLGCAIV